MKKPTCVNSNGKFKKYKNEVEAHNNNNSSVEEVCRLARGQKGTHFRRVFLVNYFQRRVKYMHVSLRIMRTGIEDEAEAGEANGCVGEWRNES